MASEITPALEALVVGLFEVGAVKVREAPPHATASLPAARSARAVRRQPRQTAPTCAGGVRAPVVRGMRRVRACAPRGRARTCRAGARGEARTAV